MSSHAHFTYVIGYRHSQERILNLRRVLDWLSGFSNIEVLIVEQDTESKISHLNLRAKHIFVKSNMPYNRSWAFNIAVRNTNTPVLAFGDSDLVMEPNQFIEAIKEVANYDVVSPYTSVIDLTPEESNYDLRSMFSINRPGRGETDNQKINICGGIVLFKREAIIKVGGWDENFIGWGGEDDLQTIKINRFELTSKELPYKCYHLWHKRESPNMTYYQRNLKILNDIGNADMMSLQNYIGREIGKIGMKNKYS